MSHLESQHDMLTQKEKYHLAELNNLSFNEDALAFQEQWVATKLWKTREESSELKQRISYLKQSIDVKSFSTDSLCGAILQIAKQGISTVYGTLDQCPDGRNIGENANAQGIKNIIWQARNQSMHYEEGDLRQATVECFDKLEASFGSNFSLSLTSNKNMAHYVIQILGWKDYHQYESDMNSLLD
ncbi:hypothetical protein VB780_30565 [Leptolyngbya sp. CCNP1308]|uniref:hypothetical protein n=1 Tax=Leptolyngbya sp. CCNP1308 TaxID=3110255 RepID=UPI002B217093|nr:hypothetical protein [Leptolyngbya sp. CCNP1308]MEA5452954.1 hypothetical protein [Leptolyngbya sp. CCNP1308]